MECRKSRDQCFIDWVWERIDHNKHEFCTDEYAPPGECVYTYPDGYRCGYRADEHPLPPEKEYNGN